MIYPQEPETYRNKVLIGDAASDINISSCPNRLHVDPPQSTSENDNDMASRQRLWHSGIMHPSLVK